jgi:hypothetical protein
MDVAYLKKIRKFHVDLSGGSSKNPLS